MSPVETQCPSCGAPIRFALGSSVVTVCANCRSVVARGDQRLEDLGKVAMLADTGSPLVVGRKGIYRGMPFELTGRAQFAHEAGGVWDEWYASFPNDRWGWLAEAQGKFYLTFARHVSAGATLPDPKQIELGHKFTLPGVGMLVANEIGRATAKSAEGEIPYRLVPGAPLDYIDLTGAGGKFATFDYGDDPPTVYLGQEVTLDDLGISPAAAPEREPRHVGAIQVNCPKCGGVLDLRAPDVAERVACPYCNSLLDCTQGKLQYLEALKQTNVAPLIPLGEVGTLEGKSYTVIGFLLRHVEDAGTKYYWQEFLLYSVGIGFRWLVESDGHWSFVKSVPPGEVEISGRIAMYQGRHFRLFQFAPAVVDQIAGEFYWKVHVGEQVLSSDYIDPPRMLSREISTVNGAKADGPLAQHGEINWSLGTYLPRQDVAKAFKVVDLASPEGVGPNQPFGAKGVYPVWAVLLAVAIVIWPILAWLRPSHLLTEKIYTLEPPTAPETTRTVFESPLTVDAHRSIHIRINAPVNNSWLAVDGDLYNEDTGLLEPFEAAVEYYSGTDSDGESWTEGSHETDEYLSAVPPGNYTLRLEAQWTNMTQPTTMQVRVEEAGPRLSHFLWLLLALSILPLITIYFHFRFESARWEDSDFKPAPRFVIDSGE